MESTLLSHLLLNLFGGVRHSRRQQFSSVFGDQVHILEKKSLTVNSGDRLKIYSQSRR